MLVLVTLTSRILAAEELDFFPTRCETCVLMSKLFDDYVMKNKRSEASMIEGMEKVCRDLAQYRLHKDKDGIDRFQKNESETMKNLKELRERGVKVELGMPDELWDVQSVEIAELKRLCETIVEQYEDAIETWYWKKGWDFEGGVCKERVLRGGDISCMAERVENEL
ncbi:unnamed protein product, partial [Mesorhabditis belari]|uniref:DUF3456 domain-containing protein n=1 Tax=Mesorhabditis belari TaxID=2138241 RepID=A0AAF3EUY3_9BILA